MKNMQSGSYKEAFDFPKLAFAFLQNWLDRHNGHASWPEAYQVMGRRFRFTRPQSRALIRDLSTKFPLRTDRYGLRLLAAHG